jgi:outer membrane protein assembly factor BamE
MQQRTGLRINKIIIMSQTFTRTLTTIIIASGIVMLSGCIKPYQPDIQQGNILNNSDLREIRYGMTKQEVLFILGTPMVIDPFNESRWDYFFSKRDQQKKETAKRLVTAIFVGDTLVELRGDVDLSKVQSLEPSVEDMQHGGTVITEPTQKEKGFFSRFLRNRKDAKAKRAIEKAEKAKQQEAATAQSE